MCRSARTKKTSTLAIDDADETDDAQATVITTNNSLRWQVDYNDRIPQQSAPDQNHFLKPP
jgi:hypothetical protein